MSFDASVVSMSCPSERASKPTQGTVVEALTATGEWLRRCGYHFVTVTPETHRRVLEREPAREAAGLRDVFGWSRPFGPGTGLLPPAIVESLRQAGLLSPGGTEGRWRSRVRFSTRHAEGVASNEGAGSDAGGLYAHSAYPTDEADAVFFGPDTYRFCRFVEAALRQNPPSDGARVLDMGCGSGAGGIASARAVAHLSELVLADINDTALTFARANRHLADDLPDTLTTTFAQGDLYAAVEGRFDRIVSNPPYLLDPATRAYRHGGGDWGGDLAERIVVEGVPRLASGGSLLLYTGAVVVDGRVPLIDALRPRLDLLGASVDVEELNPDVFGEELSSPAYARCERIAALGLTVRVGAARTVT